MGCADSVGSVLGTQSSSKRVQPNWYDPLGPASVSKSGKPIFAPTGAIPIRNGIFDQLGNLSSTFQSNSDAAAAKARTAAADPGYAAAGDLARREINGDFLNGSPQLDAALAATRAGANASSANQDARLRSQFAQNGMSFGTANQQAQESNQAATNAQANQNEATARLGNYQAERQIQQTAPAALDAANSAPINYLSAIPNEYLAPMAQAGQITAGLAGGGQIAQPDTQITPGGFSQTLGAVGQL